MIDNSSSSISAYIENMNKRYGQINTQRIGLDMPNGKTISLENAKRMQTDTLRAYNDELINRGYGLRRKDLKKKDLIDIREICTYNSSVSGMMEKGSKLPDIDRNALDKDYLVYNYWYSYIPCFNDGVLQLNDARYIEWEIKRLDVEKREMDVFVRDYFYMQNIWQIGISCVINYKFEELTTEDKANYESGDNSTLGRKIRMVITDKMTFPIIYRMIPINELRWTEEEKEVFKNLTIAYADDTEKKLKSKNKDTCDDLAQIFTHFMLRTNQELYKNKPKAVRTSSSNTKRKTVTETPEGEGPRKLIRNVGQIRMRSTKPPKHPNMEVVVHYKTAVWKARGGVRKMKSGKLVPFKESIRHRKCMTENANVPQTVIKLRGSKREKNE